MVYKPLYHLRLLSSDSLLGEETPLQGPGGLATNPNFQRALLLCSSKSEWLVILAQTCLSDKS